MVFILCINAAYGWTCTIKSINENAYACGIGNVCGLLNAILRKFMGYARTLIVTLFHTSFFQLCKMTPEQFSLFCYRTKIGKINCFENVSFVEVKHRPNWITCSA